MMSSADIADDSVIYQKKREEKLVKSPDWTPKSDWRGGELKVGKVHVSSPLPNTKVMIAWNRTSLPL